MYGCGKRGGRCEVQLFEAKSTLIGDEVTSEVQQQDPAALGTHLQPGFFSARESVGETPVVVLVSVNVSSHVTKMLMSHLMPAFSRTVAGASRSEDIHSIQLAALMIQIKESWRRGRGVVEARAAMLRRMGRV